MSLDVCFGLLYLKKFSVPLRFNKHKLLLCVETSLVKFIVSEAPLDRSCEHQTVVKMKPNHKQNIVEVSFLIFSYGTLSHSVMAFLFA